MQNGADFINSMLDEQKAKEDLKEFSMENLMFHDIETGRGDPAGKIIQVRAAKERKKIMAETYTYRPDWKEDTNERKAIEFEEGKEERIARAIFSMTERDALNPFYNRICVTCWEDENGVTQLDELTMTEEEMVGRFFEAATGKTVIGFNSDAFDLFTLKLKAAKYGIEVPRFFHVDVMNAVKKWGFNKELLIVPQDQLAVILGIEQNSQSDVDPAEIGDLFQEARTGMTDQLKRLLQKVLVYNQEDVRQLKEIYFKLKVAGIV